MRIRGVGWYIASVVVAIIPFGALAVEIWRSQHHTWPTLDQILGAGDSFLIAIAIAAQGVVDAFRLGFNKYIGGLAKGSAIVIGLLSVALCIAASWLWASVPYVPNSLSEQQAVAHTSEVFLAVAILFGGTMATLREGSLKVGT
jgi:hypothetical protein